MELINITILYKSSINNWSVFLKIVILVENMCLTLLAVLKFQAVLSIVKAYRLVLPHIRPEM
jgi:hypothetical protein